MRERRQRQAMHCRCCRRLFPGSEFARHRPRGRPPSECQNRAGGRPRSFPSRSLGLPTGLHHRVFRCRSARRYRRYRECVVALVGPRPAHRSDRERRRCLRTILSSRRRQACPARRRVYGVFRKCLAFPIIVCLQTNYAIPVSGSSKLAQEPEEGCTFLAVQGSRVRSVIASASERVS